MSDERDDLLQPKKPATFEMTIRLDLAGLPAAVRRWGSAASERACYLLKLNVVRSLLIISAAGVVTFFSMVPFAIAKAPYLSGHSLDDFVWAYAGIRAVLVMGIATVVAVGVALKNSRPMID